MPAFQRVRRTSAFSILLGVVFGSSLVLCFSSVHYCVSTWKEEKKHSPVIAVNSNSTKETAERRTENLLVLKTAATPSTSVSYAFDNLQKNVLKCKDKELRPAFKQRGDFWVLYNYVLADQQFSCAETVTYTTHGDYTFLDNLPVLVDRWRGPISVALYAPGYDFQKTLDSIAYLRTCENDLIRKFVSFHVFFAYQNLPDADDKPLESRYVDKYNCSDGPPYSNSDEDTYKETKKLTYPINVARNVARESAQTHFIFSSDIELYPTRHLIQNFFSMMANYSSLKKNSVFVLPIFEIVADANVPESKTELKDMIANSTAFVFHKNLCMECHKVPESEKWQQQPETEGLRVFSSAKRMGNYKFWEPFYIGTNADPLFDERLTWEGQSNKMTQGYIMCLLNYTYMILDNAFLIHKPGIKRAKDQLQKHGDLVRSTNKLIRKVIKSELDVIYGTNDECHLR